MTLQLDSSTVQWQEDFVLRLEIYAPPSDKSPQVKIDGLDQFKLRSQGTNLFQVPNGKTVKWILTYNMTATENGTFKLGPATTIVNGQRYTSNILFLTVKGAVSAEKKKPEVPVPIVHSAAEITYRVLIRMETSKTRAFRREGVVATLRLLSQLPVENLKFTQEPDFPGFLKYDFPFSVHPKAQKVQIADQTYASYELQRFLLFPLNSGKVLIPAVSCELNIRVPSGAYAAADLMLDLTRTSNLLALNVLPIPGNGSPLVGNFVLRSEMIADRPQSKLIRYVLEGEGELSTFEFPEIPVSEGQSRVLVSSTSSEIRNQGLHSTRVTSVEFTPGPNASLVVVPEVRISQFDPGAMRFSWLKLSPLPLRFSPAPTSDKSIPQIPEFQDKLGWILFVLTLGASPIPVSRIFQASPGKVRPRLYPLFHKKKPVMQISKKAAQLLYQQIMSCIGERDGEDISLTGILKKHLPREDWAEAEPIFRKLEWNAFSPARSFPLTYGDMKAVCEKVEKRWE